MRRITNAEALRHWASYPRELIERFGDEGDFARQNLLNPAIFRMLGDVAGKHVLDAGCGQGYLCRLLAKRGAHVTGVEPAEPMIGYAAERERGEQLGIAYVQADLSSWSPAGEQFDAAIANMVLMDIPDYQRAVVNCVRALKHGGSLIVSILHPCFEATDAEYNEHGHVIVREYFEEHSIRQLYGYLFHRTLSTYLNLIIRSGCRIAQVDEPQLDSAFEAQDRRLGRNVHVPAFLIIHAIKDSQ
ncbi:MAG TPA: class I SAM-dependent methyltransferase [Roseiflexaceae bacterium]|nr:class I SAM-dependent methyltransferase [Roseiflexaceae bacterium]